jgi:hypothetical protein
LEDVMGRIVDLCGEIAAAAEEGPEGLVLAPDMWDRLRDEWNDEDIEDALGLVRDSLMLAELVESADSLSARLVEVLGSYGDVRSFKRLEEGEAVIGIDAVGQLARRVSRLEEILEAYRDGASPDRTEFLALQRRLAEYGIEDELDSDPAPRGPDDDDDDEDN